jgi:hypothetical protein
MQISKMLLTLCAVALCVGTVSQAAPDSDAQAKAREALRKKMAELEAQPVSEAPATPAPKSATQPKPPKPAPVVRQPAPEPASGSKAPVFAEPTPPAGIPRATPEQIERARESVRQKIVELGDQDKATVGAPTATAPAGQPEQPVKVSQPKPTVNQPKPKVRRAPAATAFDPIPAPPSTLPASKEARLAELLKQYQADTLTPEQYHKERAKILAEP